MNLASLQIDDPSEISRVASVHQPVEMGSLVLRDTRIERVLHSNVDIVLDVERVADQRAPDGFSATRIQVYLLNIEGKPVVITTDDPDLTPILLSRVYAKQCETRKGNSYSGPGNVWRHALLPPCHSIFVYGYLTTLRVDS
jgi:hypothetical protein